MLYDGMLHAGLAYMAALGFQPDFCGKHKTVIDYVAYELGKEYEEEIQYYDRMRRQRHQFIYEPGPTECTQKELKEAATIATKFLKTIQDKIKSIKDLENQE